MIRNWGPLFISLALGIALAVLSILPPAPAGLNTSPDKFSSARAMQDVRIISAKPHPTGSEENAKVRVYLEDRLAALGMEVSTQQSYLPERALKRLNKWSGGDKSEQPIFNLIGILPGEDRTKPALLLMAHHDTVWGSPGAADDTIGIASILEIVKALKAAGTIKRDLIVLFTDGEEVGLSGAKAFFKNHTLRDKIGTVINFEARGAGGTANLFQTSANNGAAVRLFARSVKEPSATSLSTFVYNILPNDTDLTPALERDYTAYNIANIGMAAYYHSPAITPGALDERTLQHMGSQGLDLTTELLSTKEFPSKTPDAVFFDLFGFFTVIYAAFWGWLFLAGAVLCFVFSVKNNTQIKDGLNGLFRMLAFLILGGLSLYVLNILSGPSGPANYYDRLAAIPKLEWTALFLSISVFLLCFGRQKLSPSGRLGAAIPIFILGILGQVFAPTATYIITLPILICGMTSFLIQNWPNSIVSRVSIVILTALVFGYMINLGHLLMLGVGSNLLTVAILPGAIAALMLLPVYKTPPIRFTNLLIILSAMLAASTALWIRLDPIASTVPLY